jgi:Na+-transporting methylmalonyl-CoA/oxaloacetate decarboxylase gamma subunit
VKTAGYTIAFLLLGILVFVCWLIGRCVQCIGRACWGHE